jgi:hypothetical protein
MRDIPIYCIAVRHRGLLAGESLATSDESPTRLLCTADQVEANAMAGVLKGRVLRVVVSVEATAPVQAVAEVSHA